MANTVCALSRKQEDKKPIGAPLDNISTNVTIL